MYHDQDSNNTCQCDDIPQCNCKRTDAILLFVVMTSIIIIVSLGYAGFLQ